MSGAIRITWANVQAQLKAVGMSCDNLLKVTFFLADRKLVAAQRAALRVDQLGDRAPALTIIIAGIHDASWMLEIEAIVAAEQL